MPWSSGDSTISPFQTSETNRNKRQLLFDITKPDGESHENELASKHPEIAKRLRAKLDIWLSTLTPPGPPRHLENDEIFIGAGILPGK